MHYSINRAIILGFGMLLFVNASARSDEAAGTREQIIQGVRDDVRRKIEERNEIPAENRGERDASKQPAMAPANSGAKEGKPDTPK
jgi:hypothetical protein